MSDRAFFDWVLGAELAPEQTVADRLSRAGSGVESSTVDTLAGSISLERLLPTGTELGLSGTTSYVDSSLCSDTFTSNRLGLSVTQALLQGRELRANTARIEQARIDVEISEYELRGFAERLVGEVEVTFWDYALAQRQIGILEESLSLAERQRTEAEDWIKIGSLAETELAAAQAEVALRLLVEVDVRSAYIEVERFRAQIDAMSATRSFQEEKLRAKTEKFRVGRSTSLLVAAAQRDLVASQIAEIQAVANYVKALVVLYRARRARSWTAAASPRLANETGDRTREMRTEVVGQAIQLRDPARFCGWVPPDPRPASLQIEPRSRRTDL